MNKKEILELAAECGVVLPHFTNTDNPIDFPAKIEDQDVVYRLLKRAEIRRQIASRKSVQEGKPDRISDLLEEAAAEITMLRLTVFRLTEEMDSNDEVL